MKTIARLALVLTLLTTPALLKASDRLSLAALARKADFVALAQVRDTDYLQRREIPVSGSAYLRVLIPYKTEMRSLELPRPDSGPGVRSGAGEAMVEVYEQGLRESECYFPNPSMFEEGRRYLLFLRRDPDDAERYRGLPEGCAIDVLIDSENGYVVRMPVTGIHLNDAQTAQLGQLARPMQFSDPYAVVADDDLPPALRDAMQAAAQILPYRAENGAVAGEGAGEGTPLLPPGEPPAARRWIYTQGVKLADFRRLLQLEPDP
jgi:hypothetical protein